MRPLMTIGKPGILQTGRRVAEKAAGRLKDRRSRRHLGSADARRRRAILARRLESQSLESRQLLAGPELIGIQSNDGELLRDGTTLQAPAFGSELLKVSPRELVFRFDDSSPIDPDSLGSASNPMAINITRAGEDGGFEVATAQTDFGTGGQILLEFLADPATRPGVTGNGLLVDLTSQDRGAGGQPVVVTVDRLFDDVAGRMVDRVTLNLNSNPVRQATMRDVVLAVRDSAEASPLIDAVDIRGEILTPVGRSVEQAGGLRVRLSGANAAQVATDLGLGNDTRARIVAEQSGAAGRGITIQVVRRDFGGPAQPLVSVAGQRITVQINTNPAGPTTVGEFLDALNQTPTTANLVSATLERGSLDSTLGSTFGGLLALQGANDTIVPAGFVGIGDSPNEVVFRFAEPLPDDVYQVEVFGAGIRALLNEAGEAFNDGEDFATQFRINNAPQVVAVVPEPIRRNIDGSFASQPNVVEVYFTGDVDVDSVLDPDMYQLIYGRNTATPADDVSSKEDAAINLTSVEMVEANGENVVVRLVFDRPLSRVPDPLDPSVFLTGAARLKIGSDTLLLRGEPGSETFASAISDLGGGPSVRVLVRAEQAGADGDGVTLQVLHQDLGAPTRTNLSVSGRTVTVTANTNPSARATVGDLIDAINADPVARDLLSFTVLSENTSRLQPIRTNFSGLMLSAEAGDHVGAANFVPVGTVSSGQTQSVRLTGQSIDNPNPFGIAFPGGDGYQGVRDIRPDDPTRLGRSVPLGVWRRDGDQVDGITTAYYNFPSSLPGDGANIATNEHRQRAREVFSLFSEYLGIQFVEIGDTASGAVTIPTDGPLLSIGVGEQPDLTGDGVPDSNAAVGVYTVAENGDVFAGLDGELDNLSQQLLVLSFRFFDDSLDDQVGGEVFRGMMLGIGQMLGYGYADYLAQPNTQSTDSVLDPVIVPDPQLSSELVRRTDSLFPSPSDITNGQYLFRPESNDIDLYRFELNGPGKLSLSTVAERLANSSTLDTALRLYQQVDGEWVEIAANDDYFSNDSLIEIEVSEQEWQRGSTFVLGVSAAGNTTYNPIIAGSGLGGTTEGEYDLVMTFEAAAVDRIVDRADPSLELDGDADGRPGGEFNYWFQPSDPNSTIYVDSEGGGGVGGSLGSILQPYREMDQAIAAALSRQNTGNPVRTIRVIGGGTYEVGRDAFGSPLRDGVTLDVPKNVNLVIDGGSTFRMSRSRIGVGSTTESVDRSNATIQVLGTPDSEVQFVGLNAAPGAWGGIEIRGDLDFANDSKLNLEDAAVFLNHIQYADIRHGGGEVSVDGLPRKISAIELADVRASILNNQITNSAEAAISATPDTFAETRYDGAQYQPAFGVGRPGAEFFTSDVVRVGPHIRGNTVTENSFNGLQIRVETPTGDDLNSLEVNARFDDTDIVHVLSENLLIEGNPGGANAALPIPSTLLVNGLGIPGAGPVQAGDYVYRLTFVDRNGFESAPSQPTDQITLAVDGAVRLASLPAVPSDQFTGRRLYRASVSATGEVSGYELVARLNSNSTTYIDSAAQGTTPLNPELVAGSELASFADQISGATISQVSAVPAGSYVYRMTYVDAAGREVGPSPISDAFVVSNQAAGNRAIQLDGLPPVPADSDYVGRRLYRAEISNFTELPGEFRLVGNLDATSEQFIDTEFVGTDLLDLTMVDSPLQPRAGRLDPGLVVDPGVVMKLDGARIDVTFGANLYAEGTAENPVVMTSVRDSRYGAGGTFDTVSSPGSMLEPGQWSGIYSAFGADVSIANAVIAGGGGSSRIEGGFADFNVLEVHQSDLRVTDSRFEQNADGRGDLGDPAEILNGTNPQQENRVGRQTNASGTIFVRGAQPIVTGNVFLDGAGPVMSLDVNSFTWQEVTDSGRSTGRLDASNIQGNSGPLVADNQIGSTGANTQTALGGMEVRGGTVATEVVWDDTDIVHVVRGTIEVPNQHIYGGLRLESDARGSLVVKLASESAADQPDALLRRQAAIVVGGTLLTAQDQFLDVADRVGGSLQVIGQPDFPVVMTSLMDDSVGAGFTPTGAANVDTNGDGVLSDQNGDPITSLPEIASQINASGSWDGIKIREAASDANVQLTGENEPRNVGNSDPNATPGTSQYLGELAPSLAAGDASRRVGLIVDGNLSRPGDVDVFSFIAEGATQVWLDIDRTDSRLDTVLELVDANGTIVAISDDAAGDAYSTNPKDSLLRVALPGESGVRSVYHVRVRSGLTQADKLLRGAGYIQSPESLGQGQTTGAYQLQIRLGDQDVFAGTQVRFGEVRFADGGIEVIGGPLHSPLTGGDFDLDSASGNNDTRENAQRLGLFQTQFGLNNPGLLGPDGGLVLPRSGVDIDLRNPAGMLASDRLASNISGTLSGETDVDWYQFEVDYQQLTRDGAAMFLATMFDLDYAGQLDRGAMALHVFNNDGELILMNELGSNVADDQPAPGQTTSTSDLSRGSFSTDDPLIGSIELQEGVYYVAVSYQGVRPQVLDQFTNPDSATPLLRLSPIESISRVVEDRFESVPLDNPFLPENFGAPGTFAGPQNPVLFDPSSIIDYSLDDMILYVHSESTLYMVNPFTGENYGSVGAFNGRDILDSAFTDDGGLYGFTSPIGGDLDVGWGYHQIDTATADIGNALTVGGGLETYHNQEEEGDGLPGEQTLDVDSNDGLLVEAITVRSADGQERGFLSANRPENRDGLDYFQNIIYRFAADPNQQGGQLGEIQGPAYDRSALIAGAGTSPREVGRINALGEIVTGLELVENDLYAITDGGTLFFVSEAELNTPLNQLLANPDPGAIGTAVATATDLAGIEFTGLRAGPASLQGGSYGQILFGTTATGRVYAFDTEGVLQPIFSGGRTFIDTGIVDLEGLDFSTLDRNLWHYGTTRGTDAGHGYESLFNDSHADQSELDSLTPSTSLIFNTGGVDYDFPGGARGAVQSHTFSLEGYSAADLPMMYFNYFLETDAVENRDVLNVYVIDGDGVEHLAATNNTTMANDPLGPFTLDVQPLFDQPSNNDDPTVTQNWRQARVNLSEFAGQSDLALRFEFSTAGTTFTETAELRTVAADRLTEGDSVFVNGEQFTFDFAPSIRFPAGPALASAYTDATARATFTVNGQTYVLDDGSRVINAGEIAIDLLQGQPAGTGLADLSASDVASAVELVVVQPVMVDLFDFSDSADPIDPFGNPNPPSGSTNDTDSTATALPYSGGAPTTITGRGTIGDPVAQPVNADVDMLSVTLEEGAILDVDTLSDSGTPLTVRVFGANGVELDQSRFGSFGGSVSIEAPQTGLYYIGISSPVNDSYTIEGGGLQTDAFNDGYEATVVITPPDAVAGGSAEVTFSPTDTLTADANFGLQVVSQDAISGNAVTIDPDDSAVEVAAALRTAIADRFYGGDERLVPQAGSILRFDLNQVTVFPGPFELQTSREDGRGGDSDRYASSIISGAADNGFEGVYIDDVIIGFAERGEEVRNSTALAADAGFVGTAISPGQAGSAYNLEIRDASEYIASGAFSGEFPNVVNRLPGVLDGRFRTFDTNQRLADGASIVALPAASIQDGATLRIVEGDTIVTLEFDVLDADGNSNGVTPDATRVVVRVPARATAGEVADRIISVINSSQVQSLLNASAARANGTPLSDTFSRDPRINVFGNVELLEDPRGLQAVADIFVGDLRGDLNRDRDEQGVILIENSRFAYNAGAGVEINRDDSAGVLGDDPEDFTPSLLTYPRSLVEQNTENLIPGVTVRNNIFVHNDSGIVITGLEDGGNAQSNPVGFDQIVNNTILGGSVDAGVDPGAEVIESIFFPRGSISFADSVDPASVNLGPDVSSLFNDVDNVLGLPDADGQTHEFATLSLGSGGSVVVQFGDNLLVGDGTSAPDLVVFETGNAEQVRVEVSRDGQSFIDVGTIFGSDNLIDLDQFGFGRSDQFSYVRLTDLSPAGTFEFGSAGADIDAVGAISTVPRVQYTPGGQGIVVSQNSAPTLLNNILANLETGVTVTSSGTDVSQDLTVSGGNTYFRNTTDVIGQPGRFAQFVPDLQELFTDASRLVLTPQSGATTIDSSVESLEERASLATVKQAVGLPLSPIVTPRLDFNGQLRSDDPSVEPPSGLGGNVFVDRGAEDRRDQQGPRAVLTVPRGDDLFQQAGRSITQGTIYDAFEIQLIDGIAPADSAPGVGIDDGSVLPELVRITRAIGNAAPETLELGIDYRFAYEPADNTIRITPIAGIWPDNAVYKIEILGGQLNSAQTRQVGILRAQEGRFYGDGEWTFVGDEMLETDTGIMLSVLSDQLTTVDPISGNVVPNIDGQTVTIFDGVRERVFEFDTDNVPNSDPAHIAIRLSNTTSAERISELLANAVNASDLSLIAIHLRGAGNTGRLQLLGSQGPASSRDASVVVPDGGFVRQVNRSLDVTLDVEVTDDGLGNLLTDFDNQLVTIFDGTTEQTFEFDIDNVQVDPNSTLVPIALNDTPLAISQALLTAIEVSGLQVSATAASGTIQISGLDGPIGVRSATGSAWVSGNSAVGVSPGFGIQIPLQGGVVSSSVQDGQTFSVTRLGAEPVRFELDFDGFVNTPGAIPVSVPSLGQGNELDPDVLANALVSAINFNVPGLSVTNVGSGFVVIGQTELYDLNLSNTALSQTGVADRQAPRQVLIPIDNVRESVRDQLVAKFGATNTVIEQLFRGGDQEQLDGERLIATLFAEALPTEMDVERADSRVLIYGVEQVRGESVIETRIQDEVGNRILAGEVTVFVGGTLDFGDASGRYTVGGVSQPYPTTRAQGGPSHLIVDDLYLGAGVTADSDGNNSDADVDDGVRLLGALRPGFTSTFRIDVNLDPNGGTVPADRRFFVDAWFDWDGDGRFEAGEGELQRFDSAGVVGPVIGVGSNLPLPINVPATAELGEVQSRFRLYYEEPGIGGIDPQLDAVSAAASGEVEDYVFPVTNNPFQNPVSVFDVNGSGAVTPLDALVIINALNLNGGNISLAPPPPAGSVPQFPDPSGDGMVTAIDALQVINELNRLAANPEPIDHGTTSYTAVSTGVLASSATLAGEPVDSIDDETTSSMTTPEPVNEKVSVTVNVWDAPGTETIDAIVEELASQRDESAVGSLAEADPALLATDEVFASLN